MVPIVGSEDSGPAARDDLAKDRALADCRVDLASAAHLAVKDSAESAEAARDSKDLAHAASNSADLAASAEQHQLPVDSVRSSDCQRIPDSLLRPVTLWEASFPETREDFPASTRQPEQSANAALLPGRKVQ